MTVCNLLVTSKIKLLYIQGKVSSCIFYKIQTIYDKTLYIKIERFFTQSFPMICRMKRNVAYSKSYRLVFFGKKASDVAISRGPSMEKILNLHWKRNRVMHVTKVNENLYDNCWWYKRAHVLQLYKMCINFVIVISWILH